MVQLLANVGAQQIEDMMSDDNETMTLMWLDSLTRFDTPTVPPCHHHQSCDVGIRTSVTAGRTLASTTPTTSPTKTLTRTRVWGALGLGFAPTKLQLRPGLR